MEMKVIGTLFIQLLFWDFKDQCQNIFSDQWIFFQFEFSVYFVAKNWDWKVSDFVVMLAMSLRK